MRYTPPLPSYNAKLGDTIASIASEHGLRDWKRVFGHEANSELRSLRDPNLLAEGDEVFVPDLEPRSFSRRTGERHEFTLGRLVTTLELEVIDEGGQPYAGAEYTLDIDGTPVSGTLGGEATIKLEVPVDLKSATLTVKRGQETLQEYELLLGHLDPPETPLGLQMRLANLGYFSGDPDEDLGSEATMGALEALFVDIDRQELVGVAAEDERVTMAVADAYGC